MKLFCLTLSLALGGLALSPAVMAQEFGQDSGYNSQLQHQAMQQQGPAFNSQANTGEGPHDSVSSWGDVEYIQKAQPALGNAQAPLFNTGQGMVSTFKGNMGQFLNRPQLNGTQTGLMSTLGGYTGNACGKAGSGGFKGSGGGSLIYPWLPPTSTSTCDINTAF